jgi:hypothetical protein
VTHHLAVTGYVQARVGQGGLQVARRRQRVRARGRRRARAG